MRHIAVKDLQLHPECKRVPEMPPDQFAAFLADVKERGVRVPVEVQPGTNTILDGRSRFLAAAQADIAEVPVVDANLNGDNPVVYMLRAASMRRQLTDDQRAMLAEEERAYLAEKGRERRQENLKGARREPGPGRGKKTEKAAASPSVFPPPAPSSRTQAAKGHRVSERKAKQAQKVKKAAPALAEKVKAGEVKLAQAVREVEREEKRADLEEKARAAEEAGPPPWEIRQGDCLVELPKVEPGSVQLIFADPPYNVGVDYGDGKKADRLPDDQFVSWCARWVGECVRVLAAGGTMWVLIGDEYADHMGLVLRGAGLHRRAWVKWYETFGVNCANNFNRCSRHLFYCVKDPKRFTFHASAVTRPSDRQEKYGDARADPGGKVWDDVWEIPRLVGTAKERLPDFPTQLPLALLRAVVGCSSTPGELVLDPFSGSATTGVAAAEAGRRYLGIERQAKFVELATLRLKGVRHATE
jgi:DNA modification methylase/ParB-like chromosome segregation protein Spo0J